MLQPPPKELIEIFLEEFAQSVAKNLEKKLTRSEKTASKQTTICKKTVKKNQFMT